jgi:hypothetical protein
LPILDEGKENKQAIKFQDDLEDDYGEEEGSDFDAN